MNEPQTTPRDMLAVAIVALLLEACLVGSVLLGNLRRHMTRFLVLYGLVCLGYGFAVFWVVRRTVRRRVLFLIVGSAMLFRLTLLCTTPPTLSDDVYRYIWDGSLTVAGVSPYAHAVDSPLLDDLDSPIRAMVNNSWMASPYLPAAQVVFSAVYRMAPGSPLAFQIAAVIFDALAGLLLIGLLGRVGLPRTWSLIYLWHPLVLFEFAHGAHVDALMICLTMASLWLIAGEQLGGNRTWLRSLASVMALAAATLFKGVPALLLPVVARRWKWRWTLVYGCTIIAACLPFGLRDGWGLTGPLDGEGLFGALRIYGARWNFNSGLYHYLEVLITGHNTPGAVPPDVVGEVPILVAKLSAAAVLGLILVGVWHCGGRSGLGRGASWRAQLPVATPPSVVLLRAALVPLGAYLLLTTTVHPWYVTLIVPLLPFLVPRPATEGRCVRYLVAGLYFSCAVTLSYLTYLDPANLREYDSIRLAEYVPVYALLIWAWWPASGYVGRTGTG